MSGASPGAPKSTPNNIVLGVGHQKANPQPRPVIPKIKNPQYLEQLTQLHLELLKLQKHLKDTDGKLMIIFEGRDAGGKGGTLKRVLEPLNPRGVRVVALDKPTDTERTQWYFQRYVKHLPHGGEMVFYDRSWYNRAVVEPVMGFCTEQQTQEFLRFVPDYERSLTEAGVHLFKLWFSVSKEEQLRRFNRRRTNPLKQWKLSPVDKFAQEKWDTYTVAKEDMFYYTSTEWAPWTIVKSDVKKRARIAAIQYVLSQMDYEGKDESLLNYDDDLVHTVQEDANFSV